VTKRPALMAWCWLLASSGAFAAELDLSSIEEEADALTQRSSTLRRQVDPSATGDDLDAKGRYDEAMLSFLTRDWSEAARRFWVLRLSGLVRDPVLMNDVEWYLAQSLARAGMPGLATDTLDAMVADPQHPYRTGAVRELLDLYVDLGEADQFDRLYRAEVVSGNIAITDGTRFDVGRVLLRQGDLEGAKSYLSQISPGSPYWYRAAYHLGAIAVRMGTDADLDQALGVFQSITAAAAATPPTAAHDQTVVDLAWLGQARVHQARSQLNLALASYGNVRDDSAYRIQKLHELVWTFARVERWEQAEYAVDLFVLSYPDHPWAAEMRLTRGHLAYREGREEEAMIKYTDVVESLDPVSERFDELIASRSETSRTLEAMASGDEEGMSVLPPYAVTIVTKNALVTRDVDLLASMAERNLVHANLSITTLDPQLARDMEPRTSIPDARLRAIATLTEAGVPVGVMVAPLIPGLNDHETAEILKQAKQAGAITAGYVLLRLPRTVAPVFEHWLRERRPQQADKVLGRVEQTRGGKRNVSQFGQRMVGTGKIAEQIRTMFRLFRDQAGLGDRMSELDCTQFRPPRRSDGQMELF